jgi:hypothetical protein
VCVCPLMCIGCAASGMRSASPSSALSRIRSPEPLALREACYFGARVLALGRLRTFTCMHFGAAACGMHVLRRLDSNRREIQAAKALAEKAASDLRGVKVLPAVASLGVLRIARLA